MCVKKKGGGEKKTKREAQNQKQKKTKHHHTRTTEDHTPTATDHGETRVCRQVCYNPMHPKLPPLHMRRRTNQVCCEEGRQRDNVTRKNEQQTTTHVIKHAYKHEPHPYPHSSIDSKHREVHDDGDKEN